jgi:hypothetical protein
MIPTKSYKVLVASPNDVDKERRLLKRVIDHVNDNLKTLEHPCRLELYSWRDNIYPDVGLPERNLLDQIPIEGADILVAIFWKRFGTETGDYRSNGEPFLSGTEEEIEKAIEVRRRTGKPVIMIFQKLDRIPPDLSEEEIEQLRLLRRYIGEFKKAGKQRGLIMDFKSREFSEVLSKAFFKLMADICVRNQGLLMEFPHTKHQIGIAKSNQSHLRTRNQILLEIVRNSILNEQKASPQIINFWGGKGIGKTTLLNEISRLDEIKDLQLLGPLDLNDFQDKNLYDLTILNRALHRAQHSIVLFDNVDAALEHPEKLLNLEEAIREFLHENCTVIVTSQYRIYQWSKDIKFYQKDFRIPLLTAMDISQMLQKDNVSDKFVFTFGYPQILIWLSNEKSEEQIIAQKATEYFMESLPVESKNLLFRMSLLPLFNVAALERITETTDKQSITYSKYADILNTFERTGLIHWDEDWGIYRFVNSSARRLIATYHLYSDPASYRKIHQLAADYFADEAKRRSYFPCFFVSAVYHLMMMYEDKNIAKRMALEWLDHNIQPWMAFDQTAVFNAWESGGKEPDVRLEIQEILTDNNYFDVLQRLSDKKATEV